MGIKAIIPEGVSEVVVNGLHQWDYGRQLEIHSTGLPSLVELHFACAGMKDAVVRSCSVVNGVAEATIPDICLEQQSPVYAWVYLVDEARGATVKTIILPIIARTRPQLEESIPRDNSDAYTQLVASVNATMESIISGATVAGKARKADSATHATSADRATHATSADNATHAASADTATTATSADSATHATSADSATSAGSADYAWDAKRAGQLDPARSALTHSSTEAAGVYKNIALPTLTTTMFVAKINDDIITLFLTTYEISGSLKGTSSLAYLGGALYYIQIIGSSEYGVTLQMFKMTSIGNPAGFTPTTLWQYDVATL